MSIHDPIEILDAQIERMCFEYEDGVCMACKRKVGEDNLYQASPHPAAPAVCKECLSPAPDSANE